MRTVTLGGDRLGSGKKQKVELHGYERSTHDLGYLWRSTMSSGTLVPFLHEIGLPGDTFDINIGADIKTHPTVGPLFGSYKVQCDIFTADVRLYQGQLHNNKLKIGLNMAAVKLPQMTLAATLDNETIIDAVDIDNSQINPSCIHAYLGIRGVGVLTDTETEVTRDFQALYLLAYWDIYKNYYANKQEEIGAVIHTTNVANVETVDDIQAGAPPASNTLGEAPAVSNIEMDDGYEIIVNYTGAAPTGILIVTKYFGGPVLPLDQIATLISDTAGVQTWGYNFATHGIMRIIQWRYQSIADVGVQSPTVATFDLNNLDSAREEILDATSSSAAFSINTLGPPYEWVVGESLAGTNKLLASQEGLAIKTYQSDLFNNWLRTEYIDGPGGINEITAIDTSGGSFSIDTLNLSKKVYNMLNRIAVSGGTYIDWIIATYDHEPYAIAETPVYHGGLSKELIFQEVVSNADTAENPLGTLAGKGSMASKHKGGQISIKVAQHCVVIGIISLTPRIDYSQGNKWDTHLLTMDDFHKPPLDEIGFQELITEQMAWWSTKKALGGAWITKSAGKQPAWINYMTNVNETRGNFAIRDNEMFMTLNRRYEYDTQTSEAEIKDLTTYIDPVKFNYIFAQTSLDAQNFWAQVAVDMTVRRKMSAKIMPNV